MDNKKDLRKRIIGLGDHSFKKSYFPKLQDKISELNLFKAVFDQVMDMVIIINPLDGFIEYYNESAQHFFKISSINENQYLADIVSAKFWSIIKDIAEDKSLESSNHTFKYKVSSKKRTYYIDISVSVIQSNGKAFCALVIRDITERVAVQNDLIIAKEKAEDAARLKSAFLANMSHEIRTPMNGIVGFVSLLEEKDYDEVTRKNYMNIIKSSSNDLLRIIDDILDISKIESGLVNLYNKSFDLNRVLDDLFEIYTLKIKGLQKDIVVTFNKELPDEKVEIIADEVRVKQILSNLIDNAIKFTETGTIKINYIKTDTHLKFIVEDSGVGIKQEYVDVIFDRFRQSEKATSRMYGGTGLGLSICKGLIKLMNGEISVESEFGKGSTFSFQLPLIQ